MENTENTTQEMQSTGYLTVRVSTARGAIPLEGASVIIRADDIADSSVLHSLMSDRDGLTKRVSLPTPPKQNSDAPNGAMPYSLWNIDVFLSGYAPASYQKVPVYAGITSVQPAVLLPLPEEYNSITRLQESGAPDL